MAIYAVIGGTAKPGKLTEVRDALLALAQHVKEQNDKALSVEILSHIDGPGNRIFWVSRHESLAGFEAYGAQFDAKSKELLAKVVEHMENSESNEWHFYRVHE
jgi:hypothetical protein